MHKSSGVRSCEIIRTKVLTRVSASLTRAVEHEYHVLSESFTKPKTTH